jgi:hypothetical protein
MPPMPFRSTSAVRLAAAVLLLGPAFTSTASAQDVMQLDLEFRNSLQRKSPSESYTGRREGRRTDDGVAQEQINPARSQPRRHRHKT